MKRLKSERHHWWPQCLSAYWKDDGECTHRLSPNGEVRLAPPKNFGVLGNGHAIKLGKKEDETSIWDTIFEIDFQNADSSFPSIINWLESLPREIRVGVPLSDRFVSLSASDEQLNTLAECIVSLVVRSPKTRERAISVAESVRGPLKGRERDTLIAMNLANGQRSVLRSINAAGSVRGKFAVLYYPNHEFIFGDGFYQSITLPNGSSISPRMLVPLTPAISVLYAQPTQYNPEPKLFTLMLMQGETEPLNDTVQVYFRNEIFFRSTNPNIIDAFRQGEHLRYSSRSNPVDNLIYELPGNCEPRFF